MGNPVSHFGRWFQGFCPQLLLLLLLIAGCSRVQTVNLTEHRFNTYPKRIIWLQVAGLSEEHVAMLRFNRSSSKVRSPFEMMTCLGKSWNYNFYTLRPKSEDSFLGQLVGNKNIARSCDDFALKPIWKLLQKAGYRTALFESGGKQSGISRALKCEPELQKVFLRGLTVWKMEERPDEMSRQFHYQERLPVAPGEIFYDKSCHGRGCFSSIYGNVSSIFQQYSQVNRRGYLLLLRDFTYQDALQRKEVARAKEILLDLEKVLALLLEESLRDPNMLVLVTSAGTSQLEFPPAGSSWEEFEKSGKNVLFKHQSLLSPVMASGAFAENFCGFYEESDILNRMFWDRSRRSININLFNPF
jgi:hypothetical protein